MRSAVRHIGVRAVDKGKKRKQTETQRDCLLTHIASRNEVRSTRRLTLITIEEYGRG